MVQKFSSIEKLWDAVKIDAEARHPSIIRYPVRFIFLNSFNSLKEFVQLFPLKTVAIKFLKEALSSENGWLTSDEIISFVKAQEKSVLIIPLSEIVRFYSTDDFRTVLSGLLEIENGSIELRERRLYILMVGIQGRFKNDFWNQYHRKKSGIPIWHWDDASLSKIKILQFTFQTNFTLTQKQRKYCIIQNSYNWLDFWKQNTSEILISQSSALGHICSDFLPDAVFNLEEIHNLKHYVSKLAGSDLPIDYVPSEESFWELLAEEALTLANDTGNTNITAIICSHLNIQNIMVYSDEDLINLWFKHKKSYSRWLLKHWILNQKKYENTYLLAVIADIETYSDDELIKNVWYKIFKTVDTNHQSTLMQRKKYLHIIHNDLKFSFNEIEDKIENKLALISDKSVETLAGYLTNITFTEKKLAMQAIIQASEGEHKKHRQILRTLYPEIFRYMEWKTASITESFDDWVRNYFQEYNLSKVSHLKTGRLSKILEKQNKDQNSFVEWYYKFPSIHSLPGDIKGACIWVDALGAEWIPLFDYFIYMYGKDKKRYIKEIKLCRADLPSTTSCNRFDNYKRISDMDDYIHQENPYTHPDDLIQQIELLKKIVIEHVIENPCENVVIVADHGYTFLCQKRFGNSKKYNFAESHHEGRCMWTEETIPNDTELMTFTADSGHCKGKRSLIALKHTSLFNTPSREVHGGATPEEVLVPYIVVSKRFEDVSYQLKDYTKQITVKKPNILIEITPKPSIAPVLNLKQKTVCQLVYTKGKWSGELAGFKAGKYDFELKIEKQTFSLQVEIKSGIVERELF
ncbi:BREX-4 system phosphatase PglZ [Desulfococcaceae bacterium HSG9]|nr:BREX-4 system phosphatase PglZ [Desulfococcaceae bacterium HSG9]